MAEKTIQHIECKEKGKIISKSQRKIVPFVYLPSTCKCHTRNSTELLKACKAFCIYFQHVHNICDLSHSQQAQAAKYYIHYPTIQSYI